MSETAAWLPDEAPEAETRPVLAQFDEPSWLPASVLRRQAAEDRAEAREAREAQRAREERREAQRDKALGAYRQAAELRGEHVSAVALATGEDIGRSMADVFADAVAAADRQDAREAAKARREAGQEPRHVEVMGRSAWPASEYELDRLVSRTDENHRDLVDYLARTDYGATELAARAKSEGGHRAVRHQGRAACP